MSLSLLLSKQTFSPAPVSSPLSLQFHILGLAFLLLKIRNIPVSQTSVQILSESPGSPHRWSQYNCSENEGLKKFGLKWDVGKGCETEGGVAERFYSWPFPWFCFEVTGMSCVFHSALKVQVSCWVSLLSEVLYWTSSSFLLPCYSAGPWAE